MITVSFLHKMKEMMIQENLFLYSLSSFWDLQPRRWRTRRHGSQEPVTKAWEWDALLRWPGVLKLGAEDNETVTVPLPTSLPAGASHGDSSPTCAWPALWAGSAPSCLLSVSAPIPIISSLDAVGEGSGRDDPATLNMLEAWSFWLPCPF